MSAIKVYYKIGCRSFGGGLLGVIFTAISLPLDKVLELSLVPVAIEDLFYLPLLFSVDKYR